MIEKLLYRNALRWANRQRRYTGDPELDELLTGTRRVVGSCPLANTLGHGAYVEFRFWHRAGHMRHLPILVRMFVARFDRGSYPELVAPTVRLKDRIEMEPNTAEFVSVPEHELERV